jgi:ferredoxin-NADP reductase
MAAEPRTGRVESLVDHGADTRSLFLRLDAPLAFRPGQFISCLLPLDGETNRPYSIASAPEEPERLELLFNLVPGGRGSRYLFDLRPGAELRFTGPWGTFVCDQAPDAEVVFIAEGAVIAPIRPMLHRALATGRDHGVRLLHATDHPLYAAELAMAAGRDRRLSVDRIPRATLETEVRRRWVDADADRSRHFFVCGIGPIVPRLRDLLRGAGYERRAVQYEKW